MRDCVVCEGSFEQPAYGKRKTCSRGCLIELKRRKMLADPVSARPEVRKKISEAKRRGSANPRRHAPGRIEGDADPEAGEAKTASREALVGVVADGGLVPDARPRYLTEKTYGYVYEHVVLGKSAARIARERGVWGSTVRGCIRRGTARILEEANPRKALHGEMGRFEKDDERAMCHLCGGWFRNVGVHAYQRHGLTADEYRREFSLMSKTALVSEGYSEECRERQKARTIDGFLEAGRAAAEGRTASGRPAPTEKGQRGRARALEEKRSAAYAERMERLVEGHRRARDEGRIRYEETPARERAREANLAKGRERAARLREDPEWREWFGGRVSEARLRSSSGPLRGLRRERVARGLSQKELAERAGLSGSAVSFYERLQGGASEPSLDALAGALGVDRSRLLS